MALAVLASLASGASSQISPQRPVQAIVQEDHAQEDQAQEDAVRDDAVQDDAVLAALQQSVSRAIGRAQGSVVAVWRVRAAAVNELLRPPHDPLAMLREVPPNPSDPTSPNFVASAAGAGVVLNGQGFILTSHALVRPGDIHWVTTSDRKSREAQILASDPRSGLAVLKVDATDLQPIQLGDAAEQGQGRFVVALGNPHAIARDGLASASWGILANTSCRTIAPQDMGNECTIHELGSLLQTDARLSLGTEGGPLIDLNGNMIGMSTLGPTAAYDIQASYAVPVDGFFRRAVETLQAGREVEYGFLGVYGTAAQPVEGVTIQMTFAGTPAFQAGLRHGDLITHFGDAVISDFHSLKLHVARKPPGGKVVLRYLRGRRSLVAYVLLTKCPPPEGQFVTRSAPFWRGLQVDYATTASQYDQRLAAGEIVADGCLLVRQVEEQSAAWKAGLRPGMFISHVERTQVTVPADFYKHVAGNQGPVELRLTGERREGTVVTVPPQS